MMELVPWLAGGGVVLVLVLVMVLRGRSGRERRRAEAVARRVEALAAAGDPAAAARAALEAGRLDLAFELFLQAKETAQAAAVAVRRNDLRRAANLYEQIGQWERAIDLYDRVGLHRHADTLRKTHLPAPAAMIALPGAASPVAPSAPEPAPVPAPEATPVTAEPSGRELAAARLADGDIAGAAELYASLALDDEATHLWVDVLGDPARAARHLAGRGRHERAAELYELADDPARAAQAWIDAAREASRPEGLLGRIVDLAPAVALRYLEEELVQRPLSAASAEWHYQKARAVDRDGDARRAMTLYLELQEAVGNYRDVEERLAELGRALQPPAVAGRTRRTTRAPIELPAEAAPEAPPPTPAEPDADADAHADAHVSPVAAADVPAAPVADAEQVQVGALAAQVADAAVAKVRRRLRLSTLPELPAVAAVPEPPAGAIDGPIDAPPVDDVALRAARRGPPLAALEYMAGGRPCDAGNLEVFFRIGLLHQAGGNYDEALAAFTAVAEVVPGYRDVRRRIADLQAWKQRQPAPVSAADADDAADAAADRGPYELRGELGRGRHAIVYRAHDRRRGRDVALKLLSAPLSADPAVRDAFLQRARAMAAVSHPHLVSVHEAGLLDGRAFAAMELVDGQPVEALLRDGGLPIVDSLRIMKDVLDALTTLHGHGLIHGDVRPASILRGASGLVTLMDAGLFAPGAGGRPAAPVGGDPAYQAPELLAGADIDARADLFAAAVTLFELLARQRPYPDGERREPPARLGTLVAAVPAQLEVAIMRGVALEREQRWRTAAEAGGRIGAVLVAVNAYLASRRRTAAPPA